MCFKSVSVTAACVCAASTADMPMDTCLVYTISRHVVAYGLTSGFPKFDTHKFSHISVISHRDMNTCDCAAISVET